MEDLGAIYADKEIAKLEKKLNKVYAQAQKDINEKLNDFTERFMVKDAAYRQGVKDGSISVSDYENWKKGQVFQSRQWRAKLEQINNVLYNTNKVAADIVNDSLIPVFAENANYAAYQIEKQIGAEVGFNLYDANTVTRVIKDNPDLLIRPKPDKLKGARWNKQKISAQVTQSIVQGEKIPDLAKRLQKVTDMNKESAYRNARTAMTSAQNGGRIHSYRRAKSMGIELEQEWLATLDGRTRESHRAMDGQRIPIPNGKRGDVKFPNGLRFPGDPQGDPAEVYNCRCTLIPALIEFPYENAMRYDNEDKKVIKDMTYDEWKNLKQPQKVEAAQSVTRAKIDDMMKYQTDNQSEYEQNLNDLARKWFDSLTDDERAAVKSYTGSGFANMNGSLRSGVSAGAHVDEKNRLCAQALAKYATPEDMSVDRGSSLNAFASMLGMERQHTYEFVDYIVQNKDKIIGSVAKDKGFFSTSPFEGFSDKCKFRVFVPKGSPAPYIAQFSHYVTEDEALINCGAEFNVVDIDTSGADRGRIIVYLLYRGSTGV